MLGTRYNSSIESLVRSSDRPHSRLNVRFWPIPLKNSLESERLVAML